jgi:hypothetical protein
MQESADWQDLFCTRGKGLYLNCLYVMALGRAGEAQLAARTAEQINRWFWYRGDGEMLRHIAHSFSTDNIDTNSAKDSLGRQRWVPPKLILPGERYYLPYLSFREAGEWFDVFGNLLAILSGVASTEQAEIILDFVSRHGLDAYPIRAIYPPVRPGDRDWRDYYGSLNVPDHYHNGGIWPFLGGFYVVALGKAGRWEDAERALVKLAELNDRGGFNEWHHGANAEPAGVPDQAWSAGMYLYALNCVRRREVLLLQ